MDFHCHVDLYPNAREVYAVLQREMQFVWLVTTSPRAFVATSRVLEPTEKLLITPGLHPEVADKKSGELSMLLEQLASVAAVGEVGLDGSARYRNSFALQKDIFSSVVEQCQALGGRVLSIHSRAAAKEVLDILERFPNYGTAVFHWFTDSAPQLRRAISLGGWFSVGPAMLESANGRKLAALMPKERVVPESDGPFARIGGKSLMPWDSGTVCDGLSQIWEISAEDTADILATNGHNLLAKLRLPACLAT